MIQESVENLLQPETTDKSCDKYFHLLLSGLSALRLIHINKLKKKCKSPCIPNTKASKIMQNYEMILQLVSERICFQLSSERQVQVSHITKSVIYGSLTTAVAIGCGWDARMKPCF